MVEISFNSLERSRGQGELKVISKGREKLVDFGVFEVLKGRNLVL